MVRLRLFTPIPFLHLGLDLVSILVIRGLMDFVRKHSFAPFGIYRIALGATVLGWFFLM